MLLSAGLTPSWQQIMVFDELRVGGVNRARDVSWHVQGKVLNAGIAAHFLGGKSLTLTPLGGSQRRDIVEQLDALGVPLRAIETRTGTRVCTSAIDRATGKVTELIENGRPMTGAELAEFHAAFVEEAAEAAAVVLTGSLTDGAKPEYYRDLLEHVNCPAVLDFRGEGLLGCLDLKPFIVKPNREELAHTFGKKTLADEELLPAMRTLNERGATWTVVTDGANPTWASSATKLYRFHSIRDVEVISAIGSGDAMAAALAWSIREGWDIVRAVRFGIAAATENLRQIETCRLDLQKVLALAELVRVEELE
jgi:1-phosphofructokinase family hexose kinase